MKWTLNVMNIRLYFLPRLYLNSAEFRHITCMFLGIDIVHIHQSISYLINISFGILVVCGLPPVSTYHMRSISHLWSITHVSICLPQYHTGKKIHKLI